MRDPIIKLSSVVSDTSHHDTHAHELGLCCQSRRAFLGSAAAITATAALGGLSASQAGAAANGVDYLANNKAYAARKALHKSSFPGPLPIPPSKHMAVVACMDARLDVEDMLGLQTGEAHIIRNAGGVVTEDALRSLVISHHLLNTREFILIHHTKCGMLAFTDDLLKAGLEGDPKASELLSKATGRKFVTPQASAISPAEFHAFRGQIEAVDAPRDEKTNMERLRWDVRRGMSRVLNHAWIPTKGSDAITVRGFIYDVDTGLLEEVSYPGSMGSFG
jgi:carbonic anhydrase